MTKMRFGSTRTAEATRLPKVPSCQWQISKKRRGANPLNTNSASFDNFISCLEMIYSQVTREQPIFGLVSFARVVEHLNVGLYIGSPNHKKKTSRL